MAERWKPVRKYEGVYEISDQGRVRSLRHGKVLRAARTTGGYLQVNLCKEGRCRQFRIHRLVAEAFIGPIPPKQIVEHGDDNRENNWLDNIRISTYSENLRRTYRVGHRSSDGARNTNAKLSESDIKRIRALRANGVSGLEVARRFGLNKDHVCKIYTRRMWSHI